jgi:hypothetical protein
MKKGAGRYRSRRILMQRVVIRTSKQAMTNSPQLARGINKILAAVTAGDHPLAATTQKPTIRTASDWMMTRITMNQGVEGQWRATSQ